MPRWAEMKVSRSTPHNPRQLITGTQKTCNPLQSVAIYTYFSLPPPQQGGGEAEIDPGN